MNIDPKSTKKAEMSCGHCISSEGITQLLEYCVISDDAEIICPAIDTKSSGE